LTIQEKLVNSYQKGIFMKIIITGDDFLHVFIAALRTGKWQLLNDPDLIRFKNKETGKLLNDPDLIRFKNKETGKTDCPLSIVAEYLTEKPCGSTFLMPELQTTGMAEWLIIRIAYAVDKCELGAPYGRRLRKNLEKICRASKSRKFRKESYMVSLVAKV
jgi:hypothetical protein